VISDDDFTPENFATLSSLTSLITRCRSAIGVSEAYAG
jgi:hypothetical protein